VTVEDFTRIGPHERQPTLAWQNREQEASLATGPFNDILRVESDKAEVLAIYADAGYYSGKPALVRNAWGGGVAYYYGGVFTSAVARALLRRLAMPSPAEGRFTLPRSVEIALREHQDGRQFVFLLNYADTAQSITVHKSMTNLMSGEAVAGEATLAPYDVLVLRS
jgi:beta-galactosidase